MIKYIVILTLVLAGCKTIEPTVTERSKFAGDFPVDHIRNMWTVCANASVAKNPAFPMPIHWMYCDCMVNIIRARYTHKALTGIDKPVELNKIMSGIAQECVDDVINPIIKQPKKDAKEFT